MEGVGDGQEFEQAAHEDGGADGVVAASEPAAEADDEGKEAKVGIEAGVVELGHGGFDLAVKGGGQRAFGGDAQGGFDLDNGGGGQCEQDEESGDFGGVGEVGGFEVIGGFEEVEEFFDEPAQFVDGGDLAQVGERLNGMGGE